MAVADVRITDVNPMTAVGFFDDALFVRRGRTQVVWGWDDVAHYRELAHKGDPVEQRMKASAMYEQYWGWLTLDLLFPDGGGPEWTGGGNLIGGDFRVRNGLRGGRVESVEVKPWMAGRSNHPRWRRGRLLDRPMEDGLVDDRGLLPLEIQTRRQPVPVGERADWLLLLSSGADAPPGGYPDIRDDRPAGVWLIDLTECGFYERGRPVGGRQVANSSRRMLPKLRLDVHPGHRAVSCVDPSTLTPGGYQDEAADSMPADIPAEGETIGGWQARTNNAPLPPLWEPAWEGDRGWDSGQQTLPGLIVAEDGGPEPCVDSLGRPIPDMADWTPAFRRNVGDVAAFGRGEETF